MKENLNSNVVYIKINPNKHKHVTSVNKKFTEQETDYKNKSIDIYDYIVNEIYNGENIRSIDFSSKKDQTIGWELKLRRNSMQYKNDKIILEKLSKVDTERSELLGKLLEKDFTNKLYSVKFGLPDNEKCTLNIVQRHMQIKEYIKGKSLKIITDILPANIFSQQTVRHFADNKEIIIRYMTAALKDINEKWNKAIIKYHIKMPFVCDADNYFFKSYTDGIILSGLLSDDDFNHIVIQISGELSIDPQLIIEIIKLQ